MTKKPSYRFVGYTEPWEEKKLGEISTSFSGGTPAAGNKKYYGGEIPFIRSAEINSDKTELFLTKDGLDNSSAKLVEKGDILYALYGATSGEVGISKINGAINQAILSIIPKTNYTSEFIVQWLRLQKKNITDKYLQGGQGNLSGSIVKELGIFLPSLPEQTAIGSFFQYIDQFISLQQRKLEVLKEQKKTYLKLLFPAKGQTKPALRFAGFEDEWKEVKLGEVGETYTGLSGKTKEDFGHGEGKFITYVNVFNNPLTDLYGLDSVEVDDKQRRVQYGDVLFTTSSETPEDVGLSSVWMGTEDNVYLNSFCFGYRPQKGIFDLYYLAFVLRSFSVRKEFMLLAQGISRFNISKTKVMDMSIHVPSLPEQEAIGSFFQDLDKAIAKQEEKVNQLKESKQTLLRKMFI